MTSVVAAFTRPAARFRCDEGGATTVEYAVMLALIVLAAVAAIASIGTKVDFTYSTLSDNVSGVP